MFTNDCLLKLRVKVKVRPRNWVGEYFKMFINVRYNSS